MNEEANKSSPLPLYSFRKKAYKTKIKTHYNLRLLGGYEDPMIIKHLRNDFSLNEEYLSDNTFTDKFFLKLKNRYYFFGLMGLVYIFLQLLPNNSPSSST